jgi:hypothetical protein
MTEEPDNVVPLRENDGRGEFFAIDRRAWATACALGINEAVAYLVLAPGTGGDNRTTWWSVNAIETYTNISRARAQKAVQALVTAGLVRKDKGGSRPRYYIMPVEEAARSQPLSHQEQGVLDRIVRPLWVPKVGRWEKGWPGGKPYEVALGLAQKGHVRHVEGQTFQAVSRDSRPVEEPDWIWLPNAIVDGADRETLPLERIRQSQNEAALRIFGDLYHAHELVAEGGVDWHSGTGIRQEFERFRVGQHGSFVIWGFKPKTWEVWLETPFAAPHLDRSKANKGADAFWDAWRVLTLSGVVEMVAHLVEADTPEAEIIHPLPIGNGEEGERAITAAAWRAATSMVTDGQYKWALEQRVSIFVPVRAHLTNVQVVGIARLRYRPHTRATALWYANAAEWGEWVERYEAMVVQRPAGQGHATSR